MDALHFYCLESDQCFICILISPLETVSQARSLLTAAREYDESQRHLLGDPKKLYFSSVNVRKSCKYKTIFLSGVGEAYAIERALPKSIEDGLL